MSTKNTKIILEYFLKNDDLVKMDEASLIRYIDNHLIISDNVRTVEEYNQIMNRIEIASICLYFKSQGFSDGKISVYFDRADKPILENTIEEFMEWCDDEYRLTNRMLICFNAIKEMQWVSVDDISIKDVIKFHDIGHSTVKDLMGMIKKFKKR